MKIVQLRLPERLYETIAENAVRDGVKVSQHIRSLLERAMIFEKQIDSSAHQNETDDSFITDILLKNTKTTVECALLLRELVSRVAADEKEELIKQADRQSKDYVKRLQPTEE